MSKNRIYVKDLKGKPDRFELTGENANIVGRVLRLKKGDELELVDGEGALFTARLERFSRKSVSLRLENRELLANEYENKINLIQAFPKGTRIDLVIQKMVELGVNKMALFQAERSVPLLKGKLSGKFERAGKIALEALRQSKRVYLPEISFVSSLEEALSLFKEADLKLFLHEDQTSGRGLREYLDECRSAKEITFAIGPEGGFSDAEVQKFKGHGYLQARLGKEVLRTETAPIAVMSILNYKFRW